METYPRAAVERAMKIQEVILRAVAKKITWAQAGEIIGLCALQMRRWKERYQEYGYDGLFDRRTGKPSPKRVPLATVEEIHERANPTASKVVTVSRSSLRTPTNRQFVRCSGRRDSGLRTRAKRCRKKPTWFLGGRQPRSNPVASCLPVCMTQSQPQSLPWLRSLIKCHWMGSYEAGVVRSDLLWRVRDAVRRHRVDVA